MIKQTFVVAVASIIAFSNPLWADENVRDRDQVTVRQSFDNFVGLGPGVHHIKTDDAGRIQSCIVVGQSRISTVLGTAKGLQIARTRANLATTAEFVKWLKRDVDVRETAEDESILSLEGSEEDEGREKGGESSPKRTLKEAGKAVEKDSVRYSAVSRGLVRGLQVLHVDVNGEDQVYTLVMGWSADGAAAAWQVAKTENQRSARQQPVKKSGAARSISSRRATSADARKFLD